MNITSNHWGIGLVETDGQRITRVTPFQDDPDPTPLLDNMVSSLNGRARILRPAIRKGWLDGTGGARGSDPFVEVSWDRALDLLADKLGTITRTHGNSALYAGSYGWASAGRTHHAQSQLKRFLNCIGGFTTSEGNYSFNCALTALPYIVGGYFRDHVAQTTRWPVVAKHAGLVVCFGGIAMRNMQIADGGNSKHRMADNLRLCAANGVRFVNISPLRGDVSAEVSPEWLAPRPGTDVAVMLGLAHTLYSEGLHDQAFLARYCVGFDRFASYLTGDSDGQPKDADWAAQISGLSPERIRTLAREMAATRTMISCAAGVQRADWGEQPLWMVVTLAAMLGQIGLPGGGYTVGYAVNGHIGNMQRLFPAGSFPQGANPVKDFIPVAMISDMLLTPGAPYRYNGETRHFPDAKLVWWAGGNPFHHHQDLNRLRAAFQRPDTVVVNEINWTAAARHADIVLPVAASTERVDFGAGRSDNILVPMPKLADPPGEAWVEYDIYAALAARLGVEEAFTQGRSAEGWAAHLWDETRQTAAQHGIDLPDWDSFLHGGTPVELPDPSPEQVFLAEFRADPEAHPRETPSGKIEVFSETVAGFGLTECPGHAVYVALRDTDRARFPLHLISGQPKTRLHSQLDNGAYSLSHKIQGREPVLIHPDDAAQRGIADGQLVEIHNDRGLCIAGARVSDEVMPGVLFLWTGAWYDPQLDHPQARDRHGNPNVLTHDLRTSEWTQSPASHSALVDIRPLAEAAPAVQVFDPPRFVRD